MRLVFSLIFILIFSCPAQALVIYLDINNNPQERDTYYQTLAHYHPGEVFVSIPEQDAMASLFLKSLTKNRDEIFEQYIDQACSAQMTCNPVPTGNCGQIYSKLKEAERAVARVPKNPLNIDSLRAGLKQIRLLPDEQVTVAISGHFAVGSFTGNLGSISVAEIQEIFEDIPRLRRRVTQLHLLGCYTNTLAQVDTLWRKAFPRARVLVGFHGQSPVGENPRNLKFIKEITQNLYNYARVSTPAEFEEASALLDRNKKIFPALVIGDMFKVAGGKMMKVSEGGVRAKTCLHVLSSEDRLNFKRIFNGESPIPTDTGHSDLRDYYGNLMRFAGCLEEPEFLAVEKESPPAKQVIRLILYRNVVKNFSDQHRADLANFDAYLQTIGIPIELSLQNVDLKDRHALIAWRNQVRDRLGSMSDTSVINKALGLLQNFSDVLIELNPSCVPTSWIEPGPLQRSACFEVSGTCS